MKRHPTPPLAIVRKPREGDRLLNDVRGHRRSAPPPRDRREHLEPLPGPVRGQKAEEARHLPQLETEERSAGEAANRSRARQAMVKELAEVLLTPEHHRRAVVAL